MAPPTASLSPLTFPNGSATYTSPTGDQVLASVNGPVEVARREAQNPEEATIDVLVKPGAGMSGPGEKFVEGIVRGVLGRVVLTREKSMARRAVVVTLVVERNQSCSSGNGKVDERGGSYLPILPSLLNAALLSLLSAGIPMGMIYTAVLVAISSSGEQITNPSAQQIKSSTSLHVLAFSSKGNLLLNESQGSFDTDEWEKVYDLAEHVCRGVSQAAKVRAGEDVSMGEGSVQTLEQFIRETVEDKVREEVTWKLAMAA